MKGVLHVLEHDLAPGPDTRSTHFGVATQERFEGSWQPAAVDAGVAELEALLAKHAEFNRLYPEEA